MGDMFTSLFGGGAGAPDLPETTQAPTASEKMEPEAQAVRDEERRRLRSRRAFSGTLLSGGGGNAAKLSGTLLGGMGNVKEG